MSEYIYNTVTSYGAALIAQATAANPIVIVGALSKATATSGVQELATAPVSWYDGRSGDIATVSASGNVARIVAVFRNTGAARQAAKSIAVTARLASQTDADAVVLAAISDPASTIELPAESDTGQAVEFPINIAVNPGGTVTVTPGASASVADLDRFVSLHAPGQPTTGEAQTIYGDKTFTGTVTAGTFDGPLSTPEVTPNDNAATVGNRNAQFLAMYAEDFVGRTPTPTVSASPASNVPDIPVGAIVALLVKNTTVFTSGAAVYCGETIYSDGGELVDGSTYTSLAVARLRFESGGAINITGEQTYSGASIPIGMDFKVIVGGANAPGVSVDTLRCIAMRIA
jgi:hypothetical protein